MRYAAIDCGTNSIRLLVADFDQASGELSEVWRDMRIVRLGEGVDQNREFAPAALVRAFLACKEYQEILLDLGDPPLVFAATSASRDVSNRDRFVNGVRQILGVDPQIISGEQEAQLSFRGATHSLPAGAEGVALVFDIGGGSTEIIRGEVQSGRVLAATSVDLGCVRMTERYRERGAGGGLGPGLREDVSKLLGVAGARVDLPGADVVIGLSGTVTTVAALALGLDSYDPALVHHARIPAARVGEVVAKLEQMSADQRADIPAIHPGRYDVIVAGGIILTELLAAAQAQELLVSEADILDGLVLEMATNRP